MTEFSDMMLVLLLFGGYLVHHGGLVGAWEDLLKRFKRMAGEPGRKFGEWVNRMEGRDL